MKHFLLSVMILGVLVISSCTEDDVTPSPIKINFESTELGLSEESSDVEVVLVFSRATETSGTLELELNPGNLSYGADADFYTDFTDINTLSLAYEAGVESVSFSVLSGSALNIEQDEIISFTLVEAADESFEIGENASVSITFGENFVVTSGYVSADVGGNPRTHQVFVDLEKGTKTRVDRNDYDLALESAGDGYNILLNASTVMMALDTKESDFSSISTTDTIGLVLQGSLHADVASGESMFAGDFSETRFYEWDADGDQSNVFIIDRGSSSYGGENRGWKKVQVSKSGTSYVVKSADLDGSNESEFTIEKSSDYAFKYVHFDSGEASIAPESDQWDIVLTTTTQVAYYMGSYYATYNSQAAFHNYYGATKVTSINLDETNQTYEEIDLASASNAIDNASNDYNTIGTGWRALGANYTYVTSENLVYCIKDAEGNVFKLQFTSYYNTDNEVGPEFKYDLLK